MIARLIVQTLLWYGITGLVLFLAAGTLRWDDSLVRNFTRRERLLQA